MGAAESVCEYLRENKLANRFYETYEDIVDACCDAWNSLMATPRPPLHHHSVGMCKSVMNYDS